MLQIFIQNLVTEEEKDAFTTIYYQYRDYLFIIAKDILRDWHLAEDAVIEAFLRISLHFSKISPEDCPKTKRFLVIVIRSVCFDMLRKRKRDALYGSIGLEDEDRNDLLEMLPKDPSHTIIYSQEQINEVSVVGLDAENDSMKHVDMNGRDVILSKKQDTYTLFWTEGNCAYTLIGNVELDVLKKIQTEIVQ